MKVVRIILLIINIIAALAWVATTLAGTFAPSTSIWPSLLAYIAIPALAVNLLFVLLWLLMRRWYCLLSVAAIAVRYTFLGLFFQIGGASSFAADGKDAGTLQLLSFNVHQFGGAGIESRPTDSIADAFLSLIREERPDVLCLQEFSRPKGVHVVDSLMLMGYNHFFSSAGSTHAPAGTTVFSKLPFTYVKKIDQQKVMVEMLLGERRMRLCCIHMGSYSFDNEDREDIAQLRHGMIDSTSQRTLSKVKQTILYHEKEWNEQLRPLLAECSTPVVVAGDMNDIPGSWLYSRFAELLHDTYCDEGSGFGATYNGHFPRFRIDMVWRSEHFSTCAYRRIRTAISDHHPVTVTLQLQEP